MSEIDYVVPSVSVDYDGRLDLREVYSFAKKWLLERKYDLSENEYHVTEKEDGNELRIKWWAFKKVDDYSRFNIEVVFSGRGLQQLRTKNKVLVKGKVNIELESYVERDYENVWSVRPGHKFMREVYDKFFLKGKFDKYHEELREETLMLRDAVKRFLDAVEY